MALRTFAAIQQKGGKSSLFLQQLATHHSNTNKEAVPHFKKFVEIQCKSGFKKIEDAHNLFDEMLERKPSLGIISYNELFGAVSTMRSGSRYEYETTFDGFLRMHLPLLGTFDNTHLLSYPFSSLEPFPKGEYSKDPLLVPMKFVAADRGGLHNKICELSGPPCITSSSKYGFNIFLQKSSNKIKSSSVLIGVTVCGPVEIEKYRMFQWCSIDI
ncbi:hypothetical protein FRX31_002136 [Thalictrum thalictroides]|uniref:Pentatricopeptide repeat-containing protein n=1 Tax=Thalictrum thalictroides TaxID=46969 RepID=A0A7J6XGG9_THATH|nr:hypothetical protein FRX31_002136 [Thalictrum thalictroides]